jgi:CRISPR-associated protein Cas2
MAKNTFVVAYDIADPKRLREVARTMLGYGDRIQFSVFRCLMNDRQRELLISDISGIIHHTRDRVVLIDLGPAEGLSERRFRYLGRPLPPSSDAPMVI